MISSNTLFIKHLPAELAVEDREELLKLVGAVKVRVMPDSGKMKYTAFATFQNHEDAMQALSILHQKEILNRCLSVEFAKERHDDLVPHISDFPSFKDTTTTKEVPNKLSEREVLRANMEQFSRQLHGVAPALGLDYLPSPLLKYSYPPATPSVIQNITNALASVPKFYTQVLHLMNKMNLPAPFGPITPAPPLAPDLPLNVQQNFPPEIEPTEEMHVSSSEEESEYESDKDDNPVRLEKVVPETLPNLKPKKKRKAKLQTTVVPASSKKPRTEPSEVFESQPLCQKKISMKNIEQILPATVTEPVESTGGFGEIEPAKVAVDDEKEDEKDELEESLTKSDFVTINELKRKRVSTREMRTLSIFRNYSPGEPSSRLYIKNLAKQVEDKDLRYIFGAFINWNSETDKNMFDIKLMKEGRMKGQAFVSLANENQAKQAVRETNGFVLHTKPLVVQFARSAKPKDDKK